MRPLPLLAVVLLVLTPQPTLAQEIRGTALDTAGRPVADAPVALHRIGGTSAMSVATGTTDADGRFSFQVQVRDSSVYFAAMRLGDRLYIGPPVRAGVERVDDYELRADPATEAGAVASALSGGGPAPQPPAQQAPPTGGAAALFVLFLAVGAATAFVLAAPAYRRRKQRDLMIELATVENALDGPGVEHDRAELAERRAALRGQLSPRP